MIDNEAAFAPWKTAHENVNTALEITQHDRNTLNGDPEDNFAHIGMCWTALLTARGVLKEGGLTISAADVARMMVALKLCRDSNAPHADNRIDGHGYLLCLDRVEPVVDPNRTQSAVDVCERIEPHVHGGPPLYYDPTGFVQPEMPFEERTCRGCKHNETLTSCVCFNYDRWEQR